MQVGIDIGSESDGRRIIGDTGRYLYLVMSMTDVV